MDFDLEVLILITAALHKGLQCMQKVMVGQHHSQKAMMKFCGAQTRLLLASTAIPRSPVRKNNMQEATNNNPEPPQ